MWRKPGALRAQATQDDAQAGFYRPTRPGVLGQGADHQVAIANSRGPQTLADIAARTHRKLDTTVHPSSRTGVRFVPTNLSDPSGSGSARVQLDRAQVKLRASLVLPCPV